MPTPPTANFKVPDMLPPDYISAVRVDRRRSWRQVIDQSVQYFEESNQDAKLMDATFNQAYTLMTSAKAREAFELTQEPEDMRKRYGMNALWPGLPAGAPAGGAGRALCHRQHV